MHYGLGWLVARLPGETVRSAAASLLSASGRCVVAPGKGQSDKAPRIGVRASHAPPQSREEIQPVLDQLRRLDALLDILWNPKAIVTAPGSYNEIGKLIPPTYDGRWEVVRYETPSVRDGGLAPRERTYVVICQVRTYERVGGVLCLADRKHSAYAPIDERLVELMRSADAQNVRAFTAIRNKLWAQHDLVDEQDGQINEGEARAGLDHAHFKANFAGGVGNWMGKGADFGSMAEAAATRSRIIIP